MAASFALAAASPMRAPLGAIPITTPHPKGTPTPTPPPPANELPIGSTLDVVLDGTISSSTSKANEIVNAHLKNAIVLEGVTIAAAGTPVRIRILDAKPADNPDIYGIVDIYMYPLQLATGAELPLRPPTSHLNVNVSAGHASTADVENTVGDIFTPTLLLHVFRKGRNFVLEPGAVIHTRSQATVTATQSGVISVVTPAPIDIDAQTPHSSFNAMPLSTPSNPKNVPIATPTAGNPFRTPEPSYNPANPNNPAPQPT